MAIPLVDSDFGNFVDAWLELKKTSGFIANLYDKWILGKNEEQKKPRCSIIRDMLQWVDGQGGIRNQVKGIGCFRLNKQGVISV